MSEEQDKEQISDNPSEEDPTQKAVDSPIDEADGEPNSVSDTVTNNEMRDDDIVEQLTENEKTYLPDNEAAANLMKLGSVEVNFKAILGTVDMQADQFLKLGRGAIIELDQSITSNLQLQVNNHPIGSGEIQVVGETIAVNIIQIGLSDSTQDTVSADDMAAAMGGDEMDMSAAMGDNDMAAAMEGGDDMSAAMEEMDMAAAMEEGN